MAKVIFKCPHSKAGDSAYRSAYTKYIATREGVVKIPLKHPDKPASEKQLALIADILKTFPDSEEMFEYEDFLNDATMANASEFITQALEQNYTKAAGRQRYVNYLGTRPGAVKLGPHGLFSSSDELLSLNKVAEEVAEHPGVVWMPIISLRREDADRLGYDSLDNWRQLVKKNAKALAEGLKVPLADLTWYAAFHNESHHPHIHMVCYSKNPKQGFLTVNGIRSIKSELVRHIFRDELNSIYAKQTAYRDETQKGAEKVMQEYIQMLKNGTLHDPVIIDLLGDLTRKLKFHSGKKQYGYLRPPVKAIVDKIVDRLSDDKRVAQAYGHWNDMRSEIIASYTQERETPLPLSQNDTFKPIRNMVIREATHLLAEDVLYEPDEPLQEPAGDRAADAANTSAESSPPADDDSEDVSPPQPRAPKHEDGPYVEWTEQYTKALGYLYGKDDIPPSFEDAYVLLLEEAEAGNALAMHDVARMHKDGLGMEIDTETAEVWYVKALAAFLEVEGREPHKYVEYRIGKMYNAGLGTDQDHSEAAKWFQKSANEEYKYAQYSLGCLYRDGKGVEQDLENAFHLFSLSADQDFPYASFECGKACRDGVGTSQNPTSADRHFKDAYHGFVALNDKRADDKLQYRIGWMLLTGTGVEADAEKAVEYFEKSAALGNTFAQYQLAKMIFKEESPDPFRFAQAVEWMHKAAAGGNDNAMYALGKLYLDHPAKQDINASVYWFTQAADASNQFAQYRLGKLYLDGERIPKDTDAALHWLTQAATQGNQYAQYSLGMAYVRDSDIPHDGAAAAYWLHLSANQQNVIAAYQLGKLLIAGELVEKDLTGGIQWMTIAAEQGNQYAQYALGKLYLFGDEIIRDEYTAVHWLSMAADQGNVYAHFLLLKRDEWNRGLALMASSRLLNGLGKIFSQNPPKTAGGAAMVMDRKRQRELARKKGGKGISPVEQEPNLQPL